MTPRDHRILDALESTPGFRDLSSRLPDPGHALTVTGAVGSAASAAVAALHRTHPERLIVAVLPDPPGAAAVEADLESLLGEGASALFPQREALPYESDEPHLEIGGLRVEAVEALFSGRVQVLVTTVRALQERIPVPEGIAELRLTLRTGEEAGFQTLVDALEERGFERVPLVEEVGQFAVRGGIIDLFSFGSPDPVRVEFWGDEIESIRAFDVLDQRSTGPLDEVHVLPVDFSAHSDAEATAPRALLELLTRDALLIDFGGDGWASHVTRAWEHAVRVHDELHGSGMRDLVPPQTLLLPPEQAVKALRAFPRVEFREGAEGDLSLGTEPPPPIERDMKRLAALLREGAARGESTLLLCDNEGQAHRLEEILESGDGIPKGTQVAIGSLEGGFLLPRATPPLRVFTDHEIFRRSRRLRRGRRFRGAVSLESLAQLTPGDYVVHMDHGVGRFTGMQKLEVAGEEIELLAIEYAGGEVLRVPVYRLDLVERWVGEDDDATPPQVHKIGGRKWKTLRKKTEEAIAKMTAELLELYARREAASGYAFGPDTRWQKEMESSFLYEDTPDQRTATADVKRDMEGARPMDRLICGDVGYGKTEIAIRAAFKAVQDGKQVAVLAPTTILAEQHRHTFDERLADYPVHVGALSRFRSAKEASELLKRVESGDVDIVIGTHRLLSEDVVFRDLGLLIVDEEQRFGVKHKERLKHFKTSVDVLTLSATPIPRTLYLSLSRIRDLTVIRTPPRDRMPIITHVLPWSDGLVSEAIHRELDRGGQAFFLHNRVQTIHTAAERIRMLVPEAKVSVAHGQMTPTELDEVMTAFVDGETDVLVASAIIENGLDVPNANTLIVDRADRFGLSQLYQIRGRVGRSDRRAYCYLITPDGITEDARKRLRVLEHYTELGSGYSVALRDLELRGAGNLLGADQSGFAHVVGIDAYLRLLETTVRRLQQEEAGTEEHAEPEISLAGSAFLPEEYIPDPSQKLHLYRRLSKIRRSPEVEEMRSELVDRFGEMPPEVERLLDAATLRLLGKRLGIERILVRGRTARLNFRSGVVPRLQALQRPLSDRQVTVEVRRMSPLSLALTQQGAEPLTATLIQALSVLVEHGDPAPGAST
ncbi:transcription-repair coupling factor [Gemmatimonadota bacterium Y43]|uniref:transcription-repair coupling factor n=1 Tax=Gaopeijia maritima TaxID=3119007 RepID=UPI003292130A